MYIFAKFHDDDIPQNMSWSRISSGPCIFLPNSTTTTFHKTCHGHEFALSAGNNGDVVLSVEFAPKLYFSYIWTAVCILGFNHWSDEVRAELTIDEKNQGITDIGGTLRTITCWFQYGRFRARFAIPGPGSEGVERFPRA